ncbi:PIN domain-containing protein [Amaricoccus sp.]|uniref:type II toxin-antitoxin system VapC family toxin n=1 Tax=Amaricoccus sp. TaxID=1872485 RepID=UPI001B4D8688|nr:PIN domain-containing protein [Amaricoccus sp.]MBP7001684.1 PIN domain-containing protein [Amaricoccus sp.]
MKPTLVYWDSDAFLGHLQAEPGKVELCEGTLQRATMGEIVIVTSALAIAEVLWQKGAPRPDAQRAEIVRRFFRRSQFRILNVTRKTAEAAQDLVWFHGIRPKDAIHVATAIEAKAPVLETFDAGLLGKSGLIGSPPLLIRTPVAPLQSRLNL